MSDAGKFTFPITGQDRHLRYFLAAVVPELRGDP